MNGFEITTTPTLNRQAIRFLLDHRLGRLMTEDIATGEPIITPVRYVADPSGAFITSIPSRGEHARAIRAGGHTILSVSNPHRRHPAVPFDDFGQPVAERLWHVQAQVDVEPITERDALEKLLNRHVARLADVPLPLDGGDWRTAAGELIGLRLRPTALTARFREPALATA